MKEVYETTSEAAEAIGADQSTVARWISDGRLKSDRIKRGGKTAHRIRHADLIEASRGTLFEAPAVAQQLLIDSPEERQRRALSLEVVWPVEHRSQLFSVDSVMAGFNSFKALTYTVSLPAILKLLTSQEYEDAEVIFGSEKLVRETRAESVIILQGALEDELTKGYIAVGGATDPRTKQLMEWQASGRARVYAMAGGVIHTKLYFLERPGLRRVLVGSANLSETALYSGRQGEVLLAFDNEPWMWESLMHKYEAVRSLAQGIRLKQAIKPAHLVVAEDLPAGREAENTQSETATVYTFEPTDMPGDPEYLAVRARAIESHLGEALRDNIKIMPRGRASITKAVLKRINYAAAPKKSTTEDLSKLNRLDRAGDRFLYNQELILRPTSNDGIDRDALLVTQFMNRLRDFGADSETLQKTYFAVMAWLLFTPFIPKLARQIHSAGGNASKKVKHMLVIYGQSNAAKSSVVRFILTLMFGPQPSLANAQFTEANFRARVEHVGVLPIYYQDVDPGRFSGRSSNHAENIIKAYDQLVERTGDYPCTVVTANEGAVEFSNEVRNRALPLFTLKGLASDDTDTRERLDKEALPLVNRLGQDFYGEYLYRMSQILTDVENPLEFDYILASTTLVCELLRDSLRPDEDMPGWAIPMTEVEVNAMSWELKYRQVITRLARKLYTLNFPPPVGMWTMRDPESIAVGVDSVREVMRGKEFQDHWIRRDSLFNSSKVIYLDRKAVEESIKRAFPRWSLPLPPLQRLSGLFRPATRRAG